jgi:hypothetical protein
MVALHKLKSCTFMLLLLTSSLAWSGDYYGEAILGEKKTLNYEGPLDPRAKFNSSNGNLTLLDDIFKDGYLNEQIQESSFDLHHYWFDQVVEKSACPDTVLSENNDYIRYLYRLVTMSYLFEGIKLNHKVTAQLGSKNLCPVSFKDIFAGEKPQSADMKKFRDRVYGKFVNEIEKKKVEAFSKKELNEWLSSFQTSTSLTSDPVFFRLHDWCIGNKKNCRDLSVEEIKAVLGDFCAHDTKAIQMLYSEKDSYYGLSNVPSATELIKTSNAFNLINQSGMGEECLRRYGKVFHGKEVSPLGLAKQFPLLYSYLSKIKGQYLQGELFLPGALKEFDTKGLSDFLNALKPPKTEAVVVVVKPKPRPIPKPVVVSAPKVEEVKVEKPAPVVIAPPEPAKPALSAFEAGLVEMKEKKLSSFSIDMDLFRDDFEFTQARIAEIVGPIKKFQTRAALSDMKAYDLLGSEQAPIGLIFLKFLIDTENHQGLYNVVTVIGEKFYVYNDIEKKSEPHYIELKNDASTNNRWQIILLKK